MPVRHAARLRYATHYLQILRDLNGLFLNGATELSIGLSLFSLEWPSIQYAWSSAVALAATDDGARLCSFYPRAGAALLNLRLDPKQRLAWLKIGLRCARRLGDTRAVGRHLGDLAMAYRALGNTTRAITLLECRRRIARDNEDREGEASALGNLGNVSMSVHALVKARDYYTQCLSLTSEDNRTRADALGNLAVACRELKEVPHALEYHQRALTIYRQLRYRRGEGQTLNNLGVTHRTMGRYSEAAEVFAEALSIFRELKDHRGEALTLWNIGSVADKQGDLPRAIAYAKGARDVLLRIGEPLPPGLREMLARMGG